MFRPSRSANPHATVKRGGPPRGIVDGWHVRLASHQTAGCLMDSPQENGS